MTYSSPLPLISIVLPTYNGAKYIRHSIESCLNQSYRNIELIIVNDASTDSTPNIIEEYSHQDNRVKILHHSKNKKLPSALNTGFSASKGSYLTWSSDDNIYNETAMYEMLNFLTKNTKYSMVYTNYIKVGSSSEPKLIRNPYITELLFGNPIGACFLYTRRVYEAVGDYCTNSFLAEDYEYWVRIFESFEIAHFDSCLYQYSCHDNSLTASHSINTILEKTIPARERLLRIFIKSPTKVELDSFLNLNRPQVLKYKDLLLVSNLLEKLIANNNAQKINMLEFSNIISQKHKNIFRKSARKYGPILWPIYWKFKYRQKFNFNELKFFVLLFLSWVKQFRN